MSAPAGPEKAPDPEKALAAADILAGAVNQITDERGWPGLQILDDCLMEYEHQRHGSGRSGVPFTAIDEKIARSGYVLRRLVALTGFQAELVVYGGDYEERGTNVHRDCRISIRREEFESDHLKALTDFADDHGCELTVGKHGATLRVVQGNHLVVHQHDGVEVNAVTTGAAAGASTKQNS